MTAPELAGETGFDRVLGFTIPSRDARGRVVRLGPVLDTILAAHSYPAPIRHLLAEALVVTALIGSLLKDEDGQLTMQAQAEGGIVDLLVCDYRDGELRGYVRHDAERLAGLGVSPSLEALFGTGYVAITFDLAATGQRYQGIVPLEGASLSEACEHYFVQSEQVPTLIRVAVRSSGESCVAGGLLVQHLPEGEEGRERLHVELDHPEWAHVAALAGSTRHDELVDPALSLEALIWRLFHEEQEVRVIKGKELSRGCRCSLDHYRAIIARFPGDEQAAMRDERGAIVIDCAFCSRLFELVD
ncbi:Hsp33 family molecular chaperone HslO [Novosphingobium sp.]|jgi:molecular chaperone Hsp33|uniref:Hsp33 family molecular chaperone HslO n=1 Tax=Novosphingobium sp. TaxID=1874826 RepID=UPI001EB70374|nr:Hsp33 family molecular chaperone HslO [Novosphingobium sp.]MBK6802762.1 Hsp33 family molecular chaperone HslO [Novosphingobium sp.]MBK9012390.1 Hsp33 family molecular chaperone HslO [Novosphingobium sp.]